MSEVAVLTSRTPAFDVPWLKANLPAYLRRGSEASFAISDLEIRYRKVSSKNATILYELEFTGESGTRTRQFYSGRLETGESLYTEYRALSERIRFQPAVGRAIVLVPDACLILLAYPNDRRLNMVLELGSGSWLQRYLRKNSRLAARDWPGQIQKASIEILRYKPAKCCTARYRFVAEDGSGHARPGAIIGKQLRKPDQAAVLFDELQALYKAWPQHRPGEGRRLPMAEPVALDRKRGIILMEEIKGVDLLEAIYKIDVAVEMQKAGRLLARLHDIPIQVSHSVSPASEIDRLVGRMRLIKKLLPLAVPKVTRLSEALIAASGDLDNCQVLLHGSFRLNHIIRCSGELVLLDLDSLRLGPPAFDIANLLASLHYLERQGRLTRLQRTQVSSIFLSSYAETARRAVSPRDVLWFLAILLINKQARKYLIRQYPDFEVRAGDMLGLAEASMTAYASCDADRNLDEMDYDFSEDGHDS